MRNRMHLTSQPAATTNAPIEAPWGTLIPDDQWAALQQATTAIRNAGVPVLLGGALALATYTGRWRNTKDVDVIVRPSDHSRAVAALQVAGFEDYFSRGPYDRSWIFRSCKDDVIYDVIWQLPNHRVVIDDDWFCRAPDVRLRNELHRAVPPEELIRVKLYVMQRERCDWVDVLNVLAGAANRIDWTWLVQRMGRDLPLLHGVLALFNWMCPGRALTLPSWLRMQFALDDVDVDNADEMERRRAALFDSRPWFAMHLPTNRPLER
jgi:hypothetical protein